MGTQISLLAQEKAPNPQPSRVSVPFARCKSYGQMGPQKPQERTRVAVSITPEASHTLAYYESAGPIGVLAPRGWYCFGTYGSGGFALSLSPQPIDASNIFSTNWAGFTEPAIEVSYRFGDTSGRFSVAEIIARVFPAHKAFATHVMEEGLGSAFKFGPYPKDALTYKSNRVVEYKTPAQTDGLGTYHSSLKKNGSPIEGVAMLIGQTPDLLHFVSAAAPGIKWTCLSDYSSN